MPKHVTSHTEIEAPGTPTKILREAVGHANTGDERVSIALMESPAGWSEAPHTPQYDYWVVVTKGSVTIAHDDGDMVLEAGHTGHVQPGERVQISTPNGAEYVAVCLPAFHPDIVDREDD